jgi:hypothetical protein
MIPTWVGKLMEFFGERVGEKIRDRRERKKKKPKGEPWKNGFVEVAEQLEDMRIENEDLKKELAKKRDEKNKRTAMEIAEDLGPAELDDYPMSKPTCKWKESEHGQFETSCGKIFELISGDIEENDFKFCPYCCGEIDNSDPE